MNEMEQKIAKEFFRQIFQNGYKATTLAGVSRALNISTGHLSYYFPKKQDLVAELTNLALHKYFLILRETLPFLDTESMQFLLSVEYCMFVVSTQDSTIRTTYFSTHQIPTLTLTPDTVAAYKKALFALGRDVTDNEIKIAHSGMSSLQYNYGHLVDDGMIEMDVRKIFYISTEFFLKMCGLGPDQTAELINHMSKLVSLFDDRKILRRAFEMEELDYNDILGEPHPGR